MKLWSVSFFFMFIVRCFTAWLKKDLTGELLCFIVALVYIYLCWTPHLLEKTVTCNFTTCWRIRNTNELHVFVM